MNSSTDCERRKTYDVICDANLTDYEKYQYVTQQDPYILELKEETKKIIEQRGLGGFMNDTKWLRLQKAIKQQPFPPAYYEKLLTEPKFLYGKIDEDNVRFYGDWSPFYNEGMPLFFNIEYLIVVPRYTEHVSYLVKGKTNDISQEFETLLIENNIPFEKQSKKYFIYGYK